MTLPQPDPIPRAPAKIVSTVNAYNRQLAKRETAEFLAMGKQWRELENGLELRILKLAEEIAERQANGQPVSAGAIYRLTSYRDLLKQVQQEAGKYETYATKTISAEQMAFGEIGFKAAQEVIQMGVGDNFAFNRLNVAAVQNMAGITADGSPLFSVLQKRALAPDMVSGLTKNLLEATAMGWNPRKTAVAMMDGLAQGLTKALVIARTEQIRVFRQATLDQYQASGVVTRYQRHAAPQERTCLACLALDGEIYPTDEFIPSHPNCRCFLTPVIPGVDNPPSKSGEAWLEKQPEDVQRKVLGSRERFDEWKAGTALKDFVIVKDDPVWGQTLFIKSAGKAGSE